METGLSTVVYFSIFRRCFSLGFLNEFLAAGDDGNDDDDDDGVTFAICLEKANASHNPVLCNTWIDSEDEQQTNKMHHPLALWCVFFDGSDETLCADPTRCY